MFVEGTEPRYADRQHHKRQEEAVRKVRKDDVVGKGGATGEPSHYLCVLYDPSDTSHKSRENGGSAWESSQCVICVIVHCNFKQQCELNAHKLKHELSHFAHRRGPLEKRGHRRFLLRAHFHFTSILSGNHDKYLAARGFESRRRHHKTFGGCGFTHPSFCLVTVW